MSHALSITSAYRLSSGYSIPLLGFGVYQNYTSVPSCLDAFKAGYRHVDSAQVYRNEDQVGEAVRTSGLKREDVFITTKCVSHTHGYERTLKGVDESLKRFGFEYLDLFLIHDPLSGKQKRLDTYRALLECKKAGKIRSVGVSNYGVHHLEEIKEAGFEAPTVNQIELHPLCQQRPIVEYCQKNNILVQAYTPLIRGRFNEPLFGELAKKYNKEPAQVLIRWSLQKGYNPLPKSSQTSRIFSNANVYDFELSAEDMGKLDALDRGKDGAVTWNPVEAA